VPTRCAWVADEPLYQQYHDAEWGVPLFDSRKLFELLVLESFQSGLSWLTILRRREGFRAAFDGFDPAAIAGYGAEEEARLLADQRIIRHGAKIRATIANARAYMDLLRAGGDLSSLVWDVVGGRTRINAWKSLDEIPATTPESEELARRFRSRGFRFLGPTTAYAFMQAAGLVHDHTTDCFRYGHLTAG